MYYVYILYRYIILVDPATILSVNISNGSKDPYLNTDTDSIAFLLMFEIEDPGQIISSPR